MLQLKIKNLLEQGLELFNNSKFDEAEKIYKEIIKLDNKNSDSYCALGTINAMRKKYKEATSVLSYYIVCSIFFNNFEKFLKWCVVFNGNTKKSILIQFKNTPENQMELCEYIENQYKSKEMIDAITIHENILASTDNSFLKKTLRKSICEFA